MYNLRLDTYRELSLRASDNQDVSGSVHPIIKYLIGYYYPYSAVGCHCQVLIISLMLVNIHLKLRNHENYIIPVH